MFVVYFVDREKMERILQLMESNINLFKHHTSWQNPIETLALERIIHILIESILDAGNAMIDGFIMRDPGSYEDIIDILLDESVIPEDDEASLKTMISLRKSVVQNYLEIDHAAMLDSLKSNLTAIERFPHYIRRYLENELGPVTAFKA